MKNLFLALMVISFSAVSAQENASATSAKWGLRLGPNMSKTNDGFGSGNLFKDPDFKLGFVGGVFLNLPIGSGFSVQPELLYSSEGSLQEGVIGANNTFVTVFDISLNYIQIPMLIQYRTKGGFYVEAGPQVGFLVKSELENKFPANGIPSRTDLKEQTRGTAIGWGAGLGFNTKSGFGFGGRYTARLSDIYEATSPDIALKGSSIYLGVHYQFQSKKTK